MITEQVIYRSAIQNQLGDFGIEADVDFTNPSEFTVTVSDVSVLDDVEIIIGRLYGFYSVYRDVVDDQYRIHFTM